MKIVVSDTGGHFFWIQHHSNMLQNLWAPKKDLKSLFSMYFHTYFGKWSNLINMFQKGWNHQLGIICSMYLFFPATISHSRSTFHEPFWFRGEASWIYNIVLEDPGCVFTGSWVMSHVEGMIVPHPREFLIEAVFYFNLVVFVDG